jgi:hypothetical protein
VAYRVHPGVATAITTAAGPDIRDATDAGLAAYWEAVSPEAWEREGGEDSGLVVAAGLAAAPYLLRRAGWDTAVTLLDDAIVRDGSPGVVAAALPALRRTAAAAGTPGHRSVLARALWYAGRGEAGPLLRDTLAAAAAAGDYRLASFIAGDLADLLRDAGRLGEALAVAGQMAGYTGPGQVLRACLRREIDVSGRWYRGLLRDSGEGADDDMTHLVPVQHVNDGRGVQVRFGGILQLAHATSCAGVAWRQA